MSTKSNRSSGTQHNARGVTQGVTLVDPVTGLPVDVVEDVEGINRLAVDANITAQVGDVHVELEYHEDSTAIGDPNTDTTLRIEPDGSINANTEIDAADGDNVGLQVQERNLSPSDAQYNKRVTAKTGTLDTDTTSLDTSLHDHEGNAYTPINPLPTAGSYEKFFALIAASKWMELATYDQIIPSLSVGNTVLTLSYYEDGAFLGEAVITDFALPTGWNIKLNRYLTDDDNTALTDDDNTLLNLE